MRHAKNVAARTTLHAAETSVVLGNDKKKQETVLYFHGNTL